MYSVANNKILGFIWIIVKKCFSYRHARNPIHRVYRISVVLCYTMIAMAITVIFYMFNKGEGKLTAAKHTSMVNVSAWLGILMSFFSSQGICCRIIPICSTCCFLLLSLLYILTNEAKNTCLTPFYYANKSYTNFKSNIVPNLDLL